MPRCIKKVNGRWALVEISRFQHKDKKGIESSPIMVQRTGETLLEFEERVAQYNRKKGK